MIHLGGFQRTAEHLTQLSGKHYSRQAIQGLYSRRIKSNNGFPELRHYNINGKEKTYFNLTEVTKWYKSKHPERDARPQALANIEARKRNAAQPPVSPVTDQ